MAEQNQNKKDNRGYLYPYNKTKPTHPDYSGTVTVDGKELRIAAWQNKTAEGKEYLSLIFSPPLTLEQQNNLKKNETPNVNNNNSLSSGAAATATSSNKSETDKAENYYDSNSFDLDSDLESILNLNNDDDSNPFAIDK